MISVIVCSNDYAAYQIHRAHIGATVGCGHEYIRINNIDNTYGLCAAYNIGVDKAVGEYLVFVHEDVYFVTREWGKILEDKFIKNSSMGIVGVAGTQYLFKDNPFWTSAGRPFIKGKVIHEDAGKNSLILSAYSEDEADAEVVAVDGLFFCIRKSLFNRIKFDEQTFDKFHLYDLDICMQARKTHSIVVTTDILVKHRSWGSFDETWKYYGAQFLHKYKNDLPASCINQIPDPSRHIAFDTFPLEPMLTSKSFAYIQNLGKKTVTSPPQKNTDPDTTKDIVAITGMHRSGTSAVAGLLGKCGFNLGPIENLLDENKPKFDNQKGHFENTRVVIINEMILKAAAGAWHQLPGQDVTNRAGEVYKHYINDFNRAFTGNIIKDPRLSLTLGIWKKYCNRLRYVVICFRHPLSIAHSLQKRDNLPIEAGLKLWYEYNIRLIDNLEHIPAVVVDYDNLLSHLADDLFEILRVLRSPLSREEMEKNSAGFFEAEMNHNRFGQAELESLPQDIKEIYAILKSQSISVRTGR